MPGRSRPRGALTGGRDDRLGGRSNVIAPPRHERRGALPHRYHLQQARPARPRRGEVRDDGRAVRRLGRGRARDGQSVLARSIMGLMMLGAGRAPRSNCTPKAGTRRRRSTPSPPWSSTVSMKTIEASEAGAVLRRHRGLGRDRDRPGASRDRAARDGRAPSHPRRRHRRRDGAAGSSRSAQSRRRARQAARPPRRAARGRARRDRAVAGCLHADAGPVAAGARCAAADRRGPGFSRNRGCRAE